MNKCGAAGDDVLADRLEHTLATNVSRLALTIDERAIILAAVLETLESDESGRVPRVGGSW